MNTFIFAFGSLILFIPIIYILPLGFTKKGKHLIVSTSIAIACLGLLANMTFEWWQSILLLVLLVIGSVYFLHSRLGAVIYENEELGLSLATESKANVPLEETTKNKVEDVSGQIITHSLDDELNAKESEAEDRIPEIFQEMEHITDQNIEQQTNLLDEETSSADEKDEIDELAFIYERDDTFTLLEESEENEDTIELLNSKNLVDEFGIETELSNETTYPMESETEYLAEIEKMLVADEQEGLAVTEEAEQLISTVQSSEEEQLETETLTESFESQVSLSDDDYIALLDETDIIQPSLEEEGAAKQIEMSETDFLDSFETDGNEHEVNGHKKD